MSDDPGKPPRFPYVAALLCAACVGAAAWTWMRYSYAWPTTAEDVSCDFIALMQSDEAARRHRGRSRPDWEWIATMPEPYLAVRAKVIGSAVDKDGQVYVGFAARYISAVLAPGAAEPESGGERVYVGRLRYTGRSHAVFLKLDTAASRFTGASIAGLVVGAMGVFVFAVAFRHWLAERRRFREETRA